jgi:hypothetical protein
MAKATKSPKAAAPAPKPAGTSMEEKLAKRKLDALKRGIHRIGAEQTMPFAVHVLGVGKAGANVVAQVLKDLPGDFLDREGARFTALAVDIGDAELAPIRDLAAKLPSERAQVETVALEVPTRNELFSSLRRYREFLKLEYPRYYWNPNYEPWLPTNTVLPQAGEHFSRSAAKAIYGKAYYDGERPMEDALRRFARSVDATAAQSVVCVVFGLGGGTGSGMVVDMARHLSNVYFGRRNLVLGIGVAPCAGDTDEHKGAHLFPVLNELDCMGDQAKNDGVITVWGDLYRNPFTGGFLIVPQEHVHQVTKDLDLTHQRVDREIASLLLRNKGADLWETLRMLNWVGAPPTQHAAARTQYGAKWAHVLSFVDVDGPISASGQLPARLGIRPSYHPEFIEVRSADPKSPAVGKIAKALGKAFSPIAEPEVANAPGGSPSSVQFILPCVAKTDLDLFFTARDAYDTQEWEEKLSDHSWLVDLGVMLCEPAIRFEGMAGECLWGCACWVVVPYEEIRGPAEAAASKPAAATA